mmetsp:Transcript_54391/g.105085  ORF Transcript_54391/g.105085 Transcript_54391/m.105085 type:complete len:307 (-) Transcript_54391:202-1122(-)
MTCHVTPPLSRPACDTATVTAAGLPAQLVMRPPPGLLLAAAAASQGNKRTLRRRQMRQRQIFRLRALCIGGSSMDVTVVDTCEVDSSNSALPQLGRDMNAPALRSNSLGALELDNYADGLHPSLCSNTGHSNGAHGSHAIAGTPATAEPAHRIEIGMQTEVSQESVERQPVCNFVDAAIDTFDLKLAESSLSSNATCLSRQRRLLQHAGTQTARACHYRLLKGRRLIEMGTQTPFMPVNPMDFFHDVAMDLLADQIVESETVLDECNARIYEAFDEWAGIFSLHPEDNIGVHLVNGQMSMIPLQCD